MNEYKKRILDIGIKNKKIARLMGVSEGHLSDMINSQKTLTNSHETRLKEILNCYENIEL